MAIFHCQSSHISRAKGRSATAASSYRAGEIVYDHHTGEVHDYSAKRGVEHSAIVTPPNCDWGKDRSTLWSAQEAAENRKDARVAREFTVALPEELEGDDRIALARRFAEELSAHYGVAADVAVHRPAEDGDQRNHHAHIMLTTRKVTPDGMGEKSDLEKSDGKLKSEGKPTGRQQLTDIRERWATLCNNELAASARQNGTAEATIDHRSLKDQGLDRQPQKHVGPVGTNMQRKEKRVAQEAERTPKIVSDRFRENLRIRQDNNQQTIKEKLDSADKQIGKVQQRIQELQADDKVSRMKQRRNDREETPAPNQDAAQDKKQTAPEGDSYAEQKRIKQRKEEEAQEAYDAARRQQMEQRKAREDRAKKRGNKPESAMDELELIDSALHAVEKEAKEQDKKQSKKKDRGMEL